MLLRSLAWTLCANWWRILSLPQSVPQVLNASRDVLDCSLCTHPAIDTGTDVSPLADMETFVLQPELNVLFATASEAASRPVSASTHKRLSTAINRLSLNLHDLQARKRNRPSRLLSSFLLQTLPLTLSVFTASLATYSENRSVCREAVVFLGRLVAAICHENALATSMATLRSLRKAAEQCFYALAQKREEDDVPALLETLALVASTRSNTSKQFHHYRSKLLKSLSPMSSKGVPEESFISALRALVLGWLEHSRSPSHWPAAVYFDITKGISSALTIRMEKSNDDGELRNLILSLHDMGQSFIFGVPEPKDTNSIIRLACASGILHSLETVKLHSTIPYIETYVKTLQLLLADKTSSLENFTGRQLLDDFSHTDNEILAVAGVACWSSSSLSTQLTHEQLSVLTSILEVIMINVAMMKKGSNNSNADVDPQLLRSVKGCSEVLGKAYALFSSREGSNNKCVHFLQRLALENHKNIVVERFVLASAVECETTPQDAIALCDLLAFLTTRSATVFNVLATRAVHVVSSDSESMKAACGFLLSLVMDVSTGPNGIRAANLLNVMKQITSHRSKVFFRPSEAGTSGGDEDGHHIFWLPLIRALQRCLLVHRCGENFSIQCIEFFRAVLYTSETSLRPARSALVEELPALMLEEYIFCGNARSEQKRLLQLASVFDALADTVVDSDMISSCLDKVIAASTKLSQREVRLVCVLLLRFMKRCNLDVLETTLSSLRIFVRRGEARKIDFLPLCRLAVLGTDMLRKRHAVEWILGVFDGNVYRGAPTR